MSICDLCGKKYDIDTGQIWVYPCGRGMFSFVCYECDEKLERAFRAFKASLASEAKPVKEKEKWVRFRTSHGHVTFKVGAFRTQKKR